MSKKIIYLDDAIDAIKALWDDAPTAQHVSAMFDCEDAIRALPPAKPEIIKCKDCKHLSKWRSEESAKKFGQIYECERKVLNCPKPDDFCSRAERRTDDADVNT